jgi:nucleotide-binding universal stress UspA family protein
MGIFKRILFPVDLSDASNRMVPYVKEVVDTFGAELHIIHVKYIDQYYIATFVDETQLEYTAADENRLGRFVESNFKGLDVPVSILQGPPGTEIVRYAEDEMMDLIIMGHNSTGIKRAVFGSVAGYVVKYSQVPVLIVSPSMFKKKKSEQRSVA